MANAVAKGALRRAQKAKDDEFYTRIEDVERELAFYPGAFTGKRVYCPCDGPEARHAVLPRPSSTLLLGLTTQP